MLYTLSLLVIQVNHPCQNRKFVQKSVISNDRRAYVSPKSLLYLPAVITAHLSSCPQHCVECPKMIYALKKTAMKQNSPGRELYPLQCAQT